MACGGCAKRNTNRSANRSVDRSTSGSPDQYNLTGGVDVRSLNTRQIQARLEVFKRKFCKDCSKRYDCDYVSYLDCKGMNKK